MVVSSLFQAVLIDEELQLATAKSLSLSSSSLSEDATTTNSNNNNIRYDDTVDVDDHTIPYDNTTLHHQNNAKQQVLSRLEEQRIWQTSPSSVVQMQVVPVQVVLSNTNPNLDTINSSSSSSSSSSASTSSSSSLSIPTLSKASTHSNAVIHSSDAVSHSSFTMNTDLQIQKPFFIMDFLDNIDPTLLALVQERLQQQQHRQSQNKRKLSKRIPTFSPTNGILPVVERHTNVNDTTVNSYNINNSTADEALNRHDNRNDLNPCISLSQQNTATTEIIHEPMIIYNDTISTSASVGNLGVAALSSPPPPPPPPFLYQSIAMGQQYHDRGWKAARCGEWNRAIQYWEDALEIQRQIQSNHPHPVQMADTYHHIGIAYGKIEQYHDALQYFNKSLEIRIDTVAAMVDDPTHRLLTSTTTALQQRQQLHADIAASLYVIGDIYQKQNQLSMALQFFIQCKLLQEELVGIIPRIDMARTCIAIGHTYVIGQAYSDAKEAYQDAVTIFNQQWGVSSDHSWNPDDDYDDKNHSISVNNRYYAEYKATLSNLRLLEQKK